MVEIHKISLNKPEVKEKNMVSKGKIRKIVVVISLILLVIFTTTLLVFLFQVRPLLAEGRKTVADATLAYGALKNQDLIDTEIKLKIVKEDLQSVKKLYYGLSWAKFIPVAGSYWKDGERILLAGESGLAAGETVIEAVTPYADILGFKGQGSFSGGTAEDRIVKMVETLPKILPKLDEISQNLKKADEQLAQINPNRYPLKIKGKEIKGSLVKLKELVHDGVLATTDAKPILQVLPSALGYQKIQRYLTIFQNDGELRPTGGFMTAYGVLRIDKGRIRAEKSDDIYSLDKKFNSRLKPPEPIAKYLLNANLKTGIVPYYYLRDMNFSPDFKVSMETFLPNYQKIKDEPEVNGVISLDTKVLTDLLGVLGAVDVPGYGRFSLDPDKRCFDIPQIICELEYLVDVPIPGIKLARKDILGPMMQELILKAMGSPKNVWPKLFEVIIKDIEEKHILFYFIDQETQKAAEVFGAAGRLGDYEGDYLHINDANFGGAKSNLFVKEEIEKEMIKDAGGKMVTTLTISYSNPVAMSNCNLERKTGLCLNGILRDYLRVYVPKGSKLIEGLGSEEKFVSGEDLDKTYFAGFFTLRGDGGKAKVVLRYETPIDFDLDKEYKLMVQKQPGTLGHPIIIKINGKEESFELRKDKKVELKF